MKAKVYTTKDMQKAHALGRAEGHRQMCDFAILLMVWALHDTFDMPSDELQKVIKFVEHKSHFFTDGELTPDDVRTMLREEKGITIDIVRNGVKKQ